MTSHISADFRRAADRLPKEIRQRAREACQLFREHPEHPSLKFKKLPPFDNIWSIRITGSYRAIGRRKGDEIVWFFIGSHADYDRVIARF